MGRSKSSFFNPSFTSHTVTDTYSLYPLNQGTHVVSKALLPVGNVPIINLVLDWVLESGLRGELLNR
jgi:hypothetical protein